MTLTIEEIKEKKSWLSGELNSSLKEKFNQEGLHISIGIGRNEDGDPDFAARISDLENPDEFVNSEVVDYTRQKIQELVPGSKPNVAAITVPRAQ